MYLFSGTSNLKLAQGISEFLTYKTQSPYPLRELNIDRFRDGEISVEIPENVRGQNVFIIQSISSPANDNLMELMLIVDAMRRSSVSSISAIVPYLGYARQDRRPRSARVPISARVVANMLSNVGIDRILTLELHADQIQGFFDIPVDNIYSTKLFANDINKKELDNLRIVSPDVGGVLRARSISKQVNDAELIIIDKRRPKANSSEVMNVIGDVNETNCVIIDDLADTCGTIIKASDALLERGAKTVRAYCTHPVLSGNAIENFNKSSLTELVITNSIQLNVEKLQNTNRIRVIDISELLSDAILRINSGNSLKNLS
jgi:ribose-phosphate pyrophosphokinase